MRFVVTAQDIESHPILRKRGYEVGSVADTKHFEPALKLRPSAQERAEAVTAPSLETYPTPEETAQTAGQEDANKTVDTGSNKPAPKAAKPKSKAKPNKKS